VNFDFQNLTQNVFDQKWSNLCVPISVTTLLRFAIDKDLSFVDHNNEFTFDKILTNLTMRIYPRSLAGLNLNPKNDESDFQTNDVETMLERICKKTYLKDSGWEIVREQGYRVPAKSTCVYKKGKKLFQLLKKIYFQSRSTKISLSRAHSPSLALIFFQLAKSFFTK